MIKMKRRRKCWSTKTKGGIQSIKPVVSVPGTFTVTVTFENKRSIALPLGLVTRRGLDLAKTLDGED